MTIDSVPHGKSHMQCKILLREKVPVMTGMSAAPQGGGGKTDGCANRG